MSNSTDYRKYIKEALAEKVANNPAYSMRAFARKVDVSPSHLSRVLNGHKELSIAAALRLSVELGLGISERERFLDLVSFATADLHTKKVLSQKLFKSAKSIQRITMNTEVFKLLSDWHNFAILELMRTKSFQSSPTWIAQRLGLKLAQVQGALSILERVKLITIDSKGSIVRTSDAIPETTDDRSSWAIKKHHEQVSLKAAASVNQPLDEREFQSVQM